MCTKSKWGGALMIFLHCISLIKDLTPGAPLAYLSLSTPVNDVFKVNFMASNSPESRSFLLTPVDDTKSEEPDEVATLSLAAVSDGRVAFGSNAQLIIEDDEGFGIYLLTHLALCKEQVLSNKVRNPPFLCGDMIMVCNALSLSCILMLATTTGSIFPCAGDVVFRVESYTFMEDNGVGRVVVDGPRNFPGGIFSVQISGGQFLVHMFIHRLSIPLRVYTKSS